MERTHYKQEINITDALMNRINELLSHYPEDKSKSALIPVLHEVQDAHDNWLSFELQDKVAEILKIQPVEVYEVVTFYTMFNTKPVGKYMFEFCQTSPCCQRGVEDLMDYTCEKLGVKLGETTADGYFSVVGVECLGACGYAPMMQLGDYYKEHLTKEKIDQLITDCKEGKITLHDK
ncbi:NAD(P)H-dependent oxidoreductase subunit E [Flavobacterium branchiophilum NBRC 15030 = ATCC 35035]|uniref:NAD(P)H-dependent oxidoreductase subunit E n=1 Tax=Flavobacterium branchiophilum TaxID=55197 RepID=A0A2H3KD23_9FLAO|nr:NAD(P)H-dependent oxidoreductase subunit E [Flavobacterium branchiophilum]OXA70505.1 NAD(P)H-dependent oxidoreductase subunit E [Flavobacterium branchiophilum NBRC 15030 = ATCC 35035]PDS25477.1 NAD(P)H-dependent oxidoreductase subunit E [Flavobacterium branchiophilum]TQM41121.1 NADH dehydrogenase subunit E [Flavobacterium branchiophilum]GEM55569.1 NADH dehydrogenase subunit E [Flavobacterium branchiophilum NBRC 15030 = ATCC 35035]